MLVDNCHLLFFGAVALKDHNRDKYYLLKGTELVVFIFACTTENILEDLKHIYGPTHLTPINTKSRSQGSGVDIFKILPR